MYIKGSLKKILFGVCCLINVFPQNESTFSENTMETTSDQQRPALQPATRSVEER